MYSLTLSCIHATGTTNRSGCRCSLRTCSSSSCRLPCGKTPPECRRPPASPLRGASLCDPREAGTDCVTPTMPQAKAGWAAGVPATWPTWSQDRLRDPRHAPGKGGVGCGGPCCVTYVKPGRAAWPPPCPRQRRDGLQGSPLRDPREAGPGCTMVATTPAQPAGPGRRLCSRSSAGRGFAELRWIKPEWTMCASRAGAGFEPRAGGSHLRGEAALARAGRREPLLQMPLVRLEMQTAPTGCTGRRALCSVKCC